MLRFASASCLCLLLAGAAYAQPVADVAQAEDASGLGAPQPTRARLVVLPAIGRGVDPVVAPHVTTRLRETAEALGYELVDDISARASLARLRLREAVSPADLWRATFVAGARRGVATHVWAERGRYVFEIVVASLDGTGPFRARGDASADELLDRVAEELRRLLAPASEWNQAEATRLAQGLTAPPSAGPILQPPPFRPPPPRFTRRGPRLTDRPFSVALQTEAAIGTSENGFYNHLVGARIDYRFSRNFAMGVYLGYVNLRGNGGRVSNILPYFQLEHRVRIIDVDGLSVPIRAGVGFLPYNGVFVRVAGGLNLPLGDRFEIGADLLSPTFWFTPDGRATSFDIALEVLYRFGERGEPPATQAQGAQSPARTSSQ